ncbi:hypothetical protein HK096_005149, partial [Nowakowskiella sp. JEL0078]
MLSASVDTAPALQVAMQRDVRPSLDLIDRLREIGLQRDIDIPQIAAVGDQSSGKSSLLEAISGIPFPRGTGTVTRCATELRMKQIPNGTFKATVFASDNISVKDQIKDVDQIAECISRYTQKLTKERSIEFSEHSIVIELESPDVPDLTLIDLPGIIRNVRDSQSGSVDAIHNLIEKYIKQERTIILAVIPCNQDIDTVEILDRVRKIDPDSERTLKVFTKPDLIDKGAENEVLKTITSLENFGLGYIVVKNRGQKDIQDGVTMSEARKNEEIFFANHPVFRSVVINSEMFGVDALTKRLTFTLVSRISAMLPDMQKEIHAKLESAKLELKRLGDPIGSSPKEMNLHLRAIFRETQQIFEEATFGKYTHPVFKDPSLFLYTQYRERSDEFKTMMASKRPDFRSKKFIDKIENDSIKQRGRELPGFLNNNLFIGYISEYVNDWIYDANLLAVQTKENIRDVFNKILAQTIPLPRFRSFANVLIDKVLSDLHEKCKQQIQIVFDPEDLPFTLNDYLMKTVQEIMLEKLQSKEIKMDSKPKVTELVLKHRNNQGYISNSDSLIEQLTKLIETNYTASRIAEIGNQRQDSEYMSAMLEAYWKISATRFIDACVMQIDKCILRGVVKGMESEYSKQLTDDRVKGLTEESEIVHDSENSDSSTNSDLTFQANYKTKKLKIIKKESQSSSSSESEPATTTLSKSKRQKRKLNVDDLYDETEDSKRLRISKLSPPKVLLAHSFTTDTDPTGWWVSEKLDGVRAIWDPKNQVFLSRNGNPFFAPSWFYEGFPKDMSLDGEFFSGRGKFSTTVSIVRSSNSPKWDQIRFKVFDAPSVDKPFEGRLKVLEKWMLKSKSCTTVDLVEHVVAKSTSDVLNRLKKVEADGGEGLMLREPGSYYEGKRSKSLLKVKSFYDAEAIVKGYEGGSGKNQGLVGALKCEMECGIKFKIGTGLKDSDRRKPPKIGSIVTYRFQELTPDGIPRFPSFVGERIDMTGPKDVIIKGHMVPSNSMASESNEIKMQKTKQK